MCNPKRCRSSLMGLLFRHLSYGLVVLFLLSSFTMHFAHGLSVGPHDRSEQEQSAHMMADEMPAEPAEPSHHDNSLDCLKDCLSVCGTGHCCFPVSQPVDFDFDCVTDFAPLATALVAGSQAQLDPPPPKFT